MSDESKARKAEQSVTDLELNKETIQDLTEQEGDQARGGRVPDTERVGCICSHEWSGCF